MPQKKVDPKVMNYAKQVYYNAGTFQVKLAKNKQGKRYITATRRLLDASRSFRVRPSLLQQFLDQGMLKTMGRPAKDGWVKIDLSRPWQRKIAGF